MYDFLIVGAGITGATLARILTDSGASCFVIDKRYHIGGNCHDVQLDDLLVGQYGGHIFHTNDYGIWQFVNKYAEWQPYEHRVKAFYRGLFYSFPPNKMTLQQLQLEPDHKHTDNILRNMFFAGYSYKMWNRELDDIPGRVLNRIKIRNDWDDRYFQDKYQAMPIGGYTKFVKRLLDGIPTECNVDYLQEKDILNKHTKRVIYTGALDALYDYEFGRLEYRSLRFEHEWHTGVYQGCPTVNYTDYKPDYIRIEEWKYFNWQHSDRTMITKSYPTAYDGSNEPYYPVNDNYNNEMHKLYLEKARGDNLVIAGRLGRYQYIDMHQAIGASMVLANSLVK